MRFIGHCFLAGCLLCAVTASAWAQSPNVGRWYTVELILFEQRPEAEYNETWDVLPELPPQFQPLMIAGETMRDGISPATELVAPPVLPAPWPRFNLVTGREEPFVLIPRPLLTLSAEAQRVNQSRGRRTLLHLGWNMPMPGEDDPVQVRLWSGPQYGDLHEIDGTLGFYVGRFLHVEANLYWSEFGLEPAPAPDWFDADRVQLNTWQVPLMPPEPADYSPFPQFVPLNALHFNTQRRMRSNELHYLDHPRLGLLIQFTPYTPIEVEPSLLLIEPELEALDDPESLEDRPQPQADPTPFEGITIFDFGTPLQSPIDGFEPVVPRPFEEREL